MNLLRLIEEIYRTGSESHDWSALIELIARYVGARSGTFGISDISTGYADPIIHSYGLDEDFMNERWLSENGLANPWTDEARPVPPGEISFGTEVVPLNELRALPLYSEVFLPLEIEDTAAAVLGTTGSRASFLALYRSRGDSLFSEIDRKRMQPIVPHLMRASAIETMILNLGIRENVSRAALDEIEFAIFMVRALEAEPLNSRAEVLLVSGDGLASRFSRLHSTDEASDDALQNGLIAAGGGLTSPPVAVATPFPLRRGAGRLPLTCWAIPVSNRAETGLAKLAHPGSALLFVGNPERRPELVSETVARLFDLTPAEALVAAAIASGETPREYAERSDLTDNTVRWTLKQVQSKLGLRRQLDIASVVLRATPGFDK